MKTLTAIAGLTLLTAVSFAQSGKPDAYTKEALLIGLDDERHAEALYKTAIAQFGNRTPFRNLVLAEIQHQNAFIKLMKMYGVAVPPNPYLGQQLTIPTLFSDACLEFAQFERRGAAMYKEIAAKVNVKNVATVFLQQAKVSEENHAVALEKAAANNCGGTGICDGTGPKGNGGKGKGKSSVEGVQTCAMPLQQGKGNGNGVCDGSGPKGNGPGYRKGQGNGKGQGQGKGQGKGKGKASIDDVQTCAMPLPQGNRNGVCDGTGPKGNGHGYGKGNCDGTGPHGNGPGYRKGQGNGKGQGKGQGQGQGKGQGRGNGQGQGQGRGR